MNRSTHTAPTPDELEQQATAIMAAAERDVVELKLGTSREEIHAAAAVARVAGCILVWPTSKRPAQILPLPVWERAKALTEEARQMRCARVERRVMEFVRGAA